MLVVLSLLCFQGKFVWPGCIYFGQIGGHSLCVFVAAFAICMLQLHSPVFKTCH